MYIISSLTNPQVAFDTLYNSDSVLIAANPHQAALESGADGPTLPLSALQVLRMLAPLTAIKTNNLFQPHPELCFRPVRATSCCAGARPWTRRRWNTCCSVFLPVRPVPLRHLHARRPLLFANVRRDVACRGCFADEAVGGEGGGECRIWDERTSFRCSFLITAAAAAFSRRLCHPCRLPPPHVTPGRRAALLPLRRGRW